MRHDADQSRRMFLASSGSAAAALCGLAHANAPAAAPRDRIRIGQIGVTHAHASKLSAYRDSPDYEVVGIVEPDPRQRAQAESQAAFRDLPWLTEEQLLNTPGLQAVLVETHVRDLLRTAELCVSAGMHVHVDKPAGASLPHLQRILADTRQRGLLFQMGYMYRYNPAIILLRRALQEGWLGDVFEVHTVMSKVVGAEDRRALAEFPGGIMFELGCHILDLVIGVLGAPQAVQGIVRHSSPLSDLLADNMLAVLQYPDAIATVKSSAQEVDGFARRHFVVCGTGGTFHIQPLDAPTARIALAEPHGDYAAGYQEVTFPRFVRYVADAADMAQIIRGEKTADFSADHDLAVQRTLLQACQMPLT